MSSNAEIGTQRRAEIMEFISDYIDEHGYAPTITEISDAVGLASKSTTHSHLQWLIAEGRLVQTPRGWIPTKEAVGGDS